MLIRKTARERLQTEVKDWGQGPSPVDLIFPGVMDVMSGRAFVTYGWKLLYTTKFPITGRLLVILLAVGCGVSWL